MAAIDIPAPRLGALTGYLGRPTQRGLRDRRTRTEQAAAEILKEGFRDVLADHQPELVISDCEHHGAILQSVATGHRVLLLSFIYQTPPGPMMPPANGSIVPGRGLGGTRLGIRASWMALAAKKRAALLRASWAHWGGDFATAHGGAAAQLGVDLAKITTRKGFQMPWSYTLPTLFLVSQHVDFPSKLRTGQTYAGPMILRDRPAAQIDARVNSFLTPAADRPLIYAAFGSIRRPPNRFLTALIAVARGNPQMQFLIAHGTADPDALDTPSNMAIVPWAPQLDALQAADCAIFHGGAGTLGECLATATPMLIYPDALDGKGNGARVVYHGLGQVGSYADSAEQIAASLKALVSNADVRANLLQQQRHIETYETAQTAERAVAALLAAPKAS